MRAGTRLVFPKDAEITSSTRVGGPRVFTVPSGTTYRFGEAAEQSMTFHESFSLTVPSHEWLRRAPGGEGLRVPESARRLVPGSAWGTFTIAATIPIALFVGWYMYKLRPGKVLEAWVVGPLPYKVIQASEADGLCAWLKDNKYSYSGDEAVAGEGRSAGWVERASYVMNVSRV